MVSIYIVLSLVTIFSSFTETLGSEETKILDDILAEMREMDRVMDNRMKKLIRQVENLRDSHIPTNTTTPTLPLRTTTPTPSTPRPQTSSATPPPLPAQPSACSSYTPLTDSWRHIDYINRGEFPLHCDSTGSRGIETNLAWGSWFRFTGAAGTKLPTAPAPGGRPTRINQICGTGCVAYISSGGNPTIQDGIVTRDVCFEVGSDSCMDRTTVAVAACRDMHGDYFVYQLQPAHGCFYFSAYCAID